MNQIDDGDDPDVVLLAKFLQIWNSRHRPILIHDLADDTGWSQSCDPSQIHSSFRLSGSLQDSPSTRPQWEDMTWSDQIFRLGLGIHSRLDGDGPIGSGNTGGHVAACLNTHTKSRFMSRFILGDHQGNV